MDIVLLKVVLEMISCLLVLMESVLGQVETSLAPKIMPDRLKFFDSRLF